MSAAFDVPSASSRTHWYVYVGLVGPSASAMPVVSAISSSPTSAVPVIVGNPVGGSFAAVTSTVIELASAAVDPCRRSP